MMEKPASVRIAGPADEESIFRLLVEMHRHNNNGWGWSYRPEIILGRIERGTRRYDDKKKQYIPPRSNPHDHGQGLIGVIGPVGGPLVASVGVFLDPAMWFTDALTPIELWLYVRPSERGAPHHYERDLMAFARWFRSGILAEPEKILTPFPLLTGFYHEGKHFRAMEWLWARLSGGRKVGVMYRWD